MALVLADRVEQVTRTTGLGDLTLAETIRGRQSFQAVTSNGDTVIYVLEDSEGMAWEIGTGTVVHGAETTLQRTIIRQSSDGGSKISLSAGTHRVFLAADADYFDSIVTDADVAQAIAAHEAAADPHPQYTTEAEASAAAPVQSVNGETGTVLLDAADVGATPSSHVGTGGAQHADATTSVSGFMSDADKTKLDSVEPDAKDDQSAAEVPYSNATSGLTATDVQAAIDEVDGQVDTNTADISTNAGNIATNTSEINQRTIYVGSVAELRSSSDLLGAVKLQGYYGPGTPGGGDFYVDSDDTTTPDDGGVVFITADGKRVKRITEGETATPYWYGVPHKSVDVDYTEELQAVISFPLFAFPVGMEVSTSTLFPVSNTTGYFFDAVIKLLPGQPNITPVFQPDDDAEGNPLRNCHYYGGIIDGNRGAESGTGPGGEDGGLHGVRTASGVNCSWSDVVFRNCASDGIYIDDRRSTTSKTIDNYRFIRAVCDNNSRQGMSAIACQLAIFHDCTFTNTNGKAPQAGVDIEPDDAAIINVRFTGKTILNGNAGRGLFLHAPTGANLNVEIENGEALENGATDGLRLASGGTRTVRIGTFLTDGRVGLGGKDKSELIADRIECSWFEIGQNMDASSDAIADIDTLIIKGNVADATFKMSDTAAGSRTVNISNLYVENASASASGFAFLLFNGANKLKADINVRKIKVATAFGGVRFSGAMPDARVKMLIDEESPSENIRVQPTCTGLMLDVEKTTTDSATLVRLDGSGNEIRTKWLNATGRSISNTDGATTNNIITAIATESAEIPIFFAAGSAGCTVKNSVLSHATGGTLISNAGGHVVVGCSPLAVNSTDPRYLLS